LPTSDGISDEDWYLVGVFAAMIVNADFEETDADVALSNLLSELRRLEAKYGRLPSILSAEADFIDDLGKRLSLQKEAYASAQEIRDFMHLTMISATLAEMYVEEVHDDAKAVFWLERLELHLIDHPDDYFESCGKNVREHLNRKVSGDSA